MAAKAASGSFKTMCAVAAIFGPMADKDFVPALGKAEFTPNYDRVIAAMTRERRWRAALMGALAPKDGETIVDVGAGTGSLALLISQAAPGARVIALDPDPQVLAIAREKARTAGAAIEFVQGMGDRTHELAGEGIADAVVSSLVLHQCPLAMKSAILRSMHRTLKSGGRLRVADYGQQRSWLMNLLFRQVGMLDGFENTKPNKDGMIPALIADAGFTDVAEKDVIATPTGSISIYCARKAD